MKLFLFHCWGGDGRSCWSGSTADYFSSKGTEVIFPDFPNSSEPQLSDWLLEIRKNVKKFDPKDEWVLVGHSLGCPTILRLLESFDKNEKVKAVILVAGFAKDLGISQIKNFVETDFNWEKIKSSSDNFVVISSDNDPYIKLEEGERIAKLMGAKFVLEPGAGHINEGAGFNKYSRLIQIIEKLNP